MIEAKKWAQDKLYLIFMKRALGVLNQFHNQRTSGHINAHLMHCIYLNTFMHLHVYSPRAVAEHSLGTEF